MKAYCLKRGRSLLPNYVDFDKKRVKDQILDGFGMTFKELQVYGQYTIVRVEITEIR